LSWTQPREFDELSGVIEVQNVCAIPDRLLGRAFGAAALEVVQQEVHSAAGAYRTEIARRVCQQLGWVNRGGRLALMSGRVALLKLHRAGLIYLPPPRNGNGNGRRYEPDPAWAEPEPIQCGLKPLQPLTWQLVSNRQQSRLWNSLMARYHYLGHENLPGAQLRYLLYSQGEALLGATGFGAAAWKLAPRDQWIGWKGEQRRRGLDLIINQARFLILPSVRVPHLAGHCLGQCLRRLPEDFRQRYGWEPVLVETFVESRFGGDCYRAANWICLGQTQGRGKKGAHLREGLVPPLPVKQIWVCALRRDFRRQLCSQEGPRGGLG
jgi:hypothetical protein